MANCFPDVAIIGGGPAGAATAIALLQQGDKRVAILEKSRQNLFRIGETVPPNIRSPLTQLGVLDILEPGEHLPSVGNRSAWGSSELGYQDFFFSMQGNGWHLNRARFDASLAEAAVERGAIFKRGVGLVGCDRLTDGKWNLTFLDAEGSRFQLKTTFVVDATGRRSVFASKQGANPVRMDSLLGIAAVFEFEEKARKDCYTLVEATELGWWYAARLPDNRAIVTLMSDREQWREHQFSRWESWQGNLAKTRYVREMVAGATAIPIFSPPVAKQPRRQSRLQIQPAFSQYLDMMAGDGWLAVGDAACTFDPLSSAGIYKALRSGILAAEAIAGYFSGDRKALTEYESQTRRQFELYLEDRRQYYTLEKRWANSEFWQRRRFQISLDPSKMVCFERSPESAKMLSRLKMYLPHGDLLTLCELCVGGKQASDVVAGFLARTEGKVSAYRAIEALQYLLGQQIIR